MDDRRLDTLEQLLARHGQARAKKAVLPGDFTARVMAGVRASAEGRPAFWDVFASAARRFAPAGAIAATALYGYAAHAERLLSQAVLGFSLSGGGSLMTFAALVP